MKNSADLGECYSPQAFGLGHNTLLDLQNSAIDVHTWPTRNLGHSARVTAEGFSYFRNKHQWRLDLQRNLRGKNCIQE